MDATYLSATTIVVCSCIASSLFAAAWQIRSNRQRCNRAIVDMAADYALYQAEYTKHAMPQALENSRRWHVRELTRQKEWRDAPLYMQLWLPPSVVHKY